MLRTRSGPGQKFVDTGLRDLATGGKVGLMPHDATPARGIAKQLPAVAVGAAVEVVNEHSHPFDLPRVCQQASAALFCPRRPIVAIRQAVATTAAGANSSRAANGGRFRPKAPARSRRTSRAPPGSPVVVS